MSKANKDGWVRHRGGKCPVEKGAVVDVRYRDGTFGYKLEAGRDYHFDTEHHSGWDAHFQHWDHDGMPGDIMAWRPHKAEQATTKQSLEVEMPAAKYFDGPLQWRDRIFELDAEQRQADQAHNAATEARDAERAELAAKLKAEGLALLQAEDSQKENMSDWRNWKAGDLVERVSDRSPLVYTEGRLYKIVGLEHDGPAIENDCGDGSFCVASSEDHRSRFKWHSRPSK